MSSIPDILAALKMAFDGLPVEVYDHVPDSPTVPCICLYLEQWPYAFNEDATFIALCMASSTDMADAQPRLMDLLDGEDSIVAAIDAVRWNSSGVLSSVLPFEVRSWRPEVLPDGRRVVMAEVVLHVLR